MQANGSSFFSQLPANSVSTYVVTLTSDGKTVPTDPDQPVQRDPITPDSNGYYYHDTFENGTCDWEARGASELTLSGRRPFKDTNGLLVQNREKAWRSKYFAVPTFVPSVPLFPLCGASEGQFVFILLVAVFLEDDHDAPNGTTVDPLLLR